MAIKGMFHPLTCIPMKNRFHPGLTFLFLAAFSLTVFADVPLPEKGVWIGVVDKSGTSDVFSTLDDMTFSYSGNKQTSLENDTEAVAFEGMTGLGKPGTYTKSYDVSGRLTYDSSRGITGITYNNDGLPLKVSFRDMSQQEYEWDGLGNHVATRFYGVSYTGKQYTKMTRKYTGDGRVIDNDKEVYVHYPGGYMQDSTYYWYVKDYQGNNIAVMDGKKNFIQQTDYYPYGEPWREPSGQPWLYSGNEQLRLDGINEYDFNARRFNSVEGRFSSWDPPTEKRPWESPYSFCGGDPVNHSDPSGNNYTVNIDPDKKEITIVAVYYAFKEDMESAQNAVSFWNGQSGNFKYKDYNVNFNLTVEEVSIEDGPYNGHKNAKQKTMSYLLETGKNPAANAYLIRNGTDDNINGGAMDGVIINIRESKRNANTGAHEVGHTLGLVHYYKGIMTAEETDPNRSRDIYQSQVNTMISNPINRKVAKEGRRLAGKGILVDLPPQDHPLPEWMKRKR